MGKYFATRLQLSHVLPHDKIKIKIKIGIVLKAKFEIYILLFMTKIKTPRLPMNIFGFFLLKNMFFFSHPNLNANIGTHGYFS
jgi:hypothetical protein